MGLTKVIKAVFNKEKWVEWTDWSLIKQFSTVPCQSVHDTHVNSASAVDIVIVGCRREDQGIDAPCKRKK